VICMCAAETRDFRQKAFTCSTPTSKIISQFKAQNSVTGSGQRVKSVQFGSGHGSKVQTRF